MGTNPATPPAGDAAFDGGHVTPELRIRSIARMISTQYLFGALCLLVAVVMPAPDESDEPYLLALAGLALGTGIAMRFARRQIAVDGGITLLVFIMTGVVAVAKPMGLTPLFYFWPLMLSAYYESPRKLVGTTGLTLLLFGIVAFGVADLRDPESAFMQMAAMVTAVVFAVYRLRKRNDELFARLEHSAIHDHLTGVLNRGAFERVFGRWSDTARSGGDAGGALLMLDIDHFKAINDTHGHPAGDAALRRLVAIIGEWVRPADAVGRVGGEEFAILLPHASRSDAAAIAERIRSAVQLQSGTPTSPPFTISIGIACAAQPPDPWDAADRALYAAKRGGRNRVEVAGDDPVGAAREREPVAAY